jgi:hypothetical protein
MTAYEGLVQPRFPSRPRRSRRFEIDNPEDTDGSGHWELETTDSESEGGVEGRIEEELEHDRYVECCEAEGNISPRRRRFFACQPHVINGFHLRDNVWKKLLVDRVRWAAPGLGPSSDMVLGDTDKQFLERLLVELSNQKAYGLCPDLQKSATVLMTVRGPAADDAIDAISSMVRRPLYHVRISTEAEAGSAESTFRQAASLARKWGCIVVIDELLGAYHHPVGEPQDSLTANVAAVVRFLDTFRGIVILALPDQGWELDARVRERVCANFHFEYHDSTPNTRRALWERYIKKRTGREYWPGGLGPKAEGHLDRLAELQLSWDAIRSIVQAVVGKIPYRPVIDWDLLIEVAERRTTKVLASPLSTADPRVSWR